MTVLRIAAAQITPALFDTDATTQRVIASIIEAGQAGVALLAFGECFVPGYSRPDVLQLSVDRTRQRNVAFSDD